MADAFLGALPTSDDPDDLLHLVRAGASRATTPAHLVDMLGMVRIERQAGAGPVASVDFALPAGFPAFRLLGWTATSVDAAIAMRLSADGGSTWRTSNYQWHANAFNTTNGTHINHYTGFNISDGSALWLYLLTEAEVPTCFDITLQAARDAARRTHWHHRLMQQHTSEDGRIVVGSGLYVAAEEHDAVQIRPLGASANLVAYDLTLYGVH